VNLHRYRQRWMSSKSSEQDRRACFRCLGPFPFVSFGNDPATCLSVASIRPRLVLLFTRPRPLPCRLSSYPQPQPVPSSSLSSSNQLIQRWHKFVASPCLLHVLDTPHGANLPCFSPLPRPHPTAPTLLLGRTWLGQHRLRCGR
jgi:hypothetical protein